MSQVHQRLFHVSARKDAKFYERSSDCVEDVKDGAKLLIGGTTVYCEWENLMDWTLRKVWCKMGLSFSMRCIDVLTSYNNLIPE